MAETVRVERYVWYVWSTSNGNGYGTRYRTDVENVHGVGNDPHDRGGNKRVSRRREAGIKLNRDDGHSVLTRMYDRRSFDQKRKTRKIKDTILYL